MGSGNKLQKQKKGPWSLGEGKGKVRHLGRGREGRRRARERLWHAPWEEEPP